MNSKKSLTFFDTIILFVAFLFLLFVYTSATNYPYIFTLLLSTGFIALLVAIKGFRISFKSDFILWVIFVGVIWLRSVYFSNALLIYNVTFTLLVILMAVCKESTLGNRIIKIILVFSIAQLLFVFLEAIAGNYMSALLRLIMNDRYFSAENANIINGISFAALSESNNVVTYSCVFCLAFGFYGGANHDSRKKNYWIRIFCIAAPIFVVLFLQRQRSNLLAIPFSFLLSFLLCFKKKNNGKLIRVLTIIAFALIIFLVALPYLKTIPSISKLTNTFEMLLNGEEALEGRSLLYSRAFEMWKSKPLFGYGWFEYYRLNQGILADNVYSHAHNIVLELMVDLGIIGTIVILLPMIYTFVLNVKTLKKAASHGHLEYSGYFKLTLFFQCFFFIDSLLHVSFYNVSILIIYMLVCISFFSLRYKYLRHVAQN